MADLSITPANVLPGEGAIIEYGFAGASITQGQYLYLDTADQRYKLADADAGSPGSIARTPTHVAMSSVAADQPMAVCRRGRINPGATVVVGGIYVMSGTAGAICPVADLAAGDTVTIIGIGITASSLQLVFLAPGVTVPA